MKVLTFVYSLYNAIVGLYISLATIQKYIKSVIVINTNNIVFGIYNIFLCLLCILKTWKSNRWKRIFTKDVYNYSTWWKHIIKCYIMNITICMVHITLLTRFTRMTVKVKLIIRSLVTVAHLWTWNIIVVKKL